ncbi:hypothetical protein N658DRAFT_495291 [Parathielavia hyrcaniae]|uniref:WW domain-containing protein n=1 Tax=Parathielavia hyrcaniae TaxID=113614 RepID=A0AAN6T3C9_9PEZI|nr:hypothetical protein N658DRAFT_495291 [Parathielavia hyrcaniae]
MADFESPSGPPPPKVPEGWAVRWNDQYKEWFYVNTFTKKSQWDKPTEPAVPPRDDHLAPSGPPPSYTPGDSTTPAPSDSKKINPFETTNPAQQQGAAASYHNPGAEDEDARLARQLQAEEDARARGSSPHPSQNAYPQSHPQGGSPFPGQLPPRPEDNNTHGGGSGSRGFLGKLFKKTGHSGGGSGGGGLGGLMSSHGGSHGVGGQHHGYPQQPSYYPQQQHQQHHYGGGGGFMPPQQGYYPPAQHHGGGYYPQQGYGGGAYGRKPGGGGMGMAGGAALGVGAGMLGGYMVADAINDSQEDAYQEGFEDGGGGDFDGGGDF